MKINEKHIDKTYLKNLDNDNVKEVASEIRRFMIDNVLETGGHLSSNLGVVELTLAIHKVFDFPKDKLIFLMCGGGGYAWMTKQILLKLGYDETKVKRAQVLYTLALYDYSEQEGFTL